jgi:histidinol-phosphate aminotransferase
VLRTFSKAYGLAGFRVGYGVGPAKLVGYVNRIRAPFNVGLLSQVAAVAALQDTEHLSKTVELNERERGRLSRAFVDLGLGVVPSQANFVLVQLGQPARPVYEALLGEGLITRPLGNLPESLRITLGTEAENDRLLAALHRVLE